MNKTYFTLLLLLSTNLFGQQLTSLEAIGMGRYISSEETFLYSMGINEKELTDDYIKEYCRFFDYTNNNKNSDEFSRDEYFSRMRKVIVNKIKSLDYKKEFVSIIAFGDLSEYDFKEQCFYIKTRDSSSDGKYISTVVGRQFFYSQAIHVKNRNCYDFTRLYLNPSEAKNLANIMASHINGVRPIEIVCYYVLTKEKTENGIDLNAIITKVYIFENRKNSQSIYSPEIKILSPNCSPVNTTMNSDYKQKNDVDNVVEQGSFSNAVVYEKPGIFNFAKGDIFDYGTVNEGTLAECDFDFTNIGNAPIKIIEAHGSCGCISLVYPHENISPGQKGTIHVTYNTKGRPGPITKDIVINSNALQGRTILKIKGNVRKN